MTFKVAKHAYKLIPVKKWDITVALEKLGMNLDNSLTNIQLQLYIGAPLFFFLFSLQKHNIVSA